MHRVHSLLAQKHAQAARPAPVPRALACAPVPAYAPMPACRAARPTPQRPCAREPRAREPSARSSRARAPCIRAPLRLRAQPSLMLKWAVAHFSVCPFFFHFFFLPATGKYLKKIFIYFLSFSSTPINLLKFISSIFFFHFPTNQIICLNLFYLFFYSRLHIVNSKVCFPTCLCAIYLSTQTFTSYIHDHTTFHQITQNIPNTCMECPSFVP